ncbi:G kinase-anchoring protein 1-like isoform X1 [Cloeon dipterum]|uniref:G kinase-anchoring protein 1-like isoform X1 n=1 Tax=Cloeon dipterum TaxID=197152 RepID=UPI003220266F
MATAVASRFSVLSVDVEDDSAKVKKSEKKKSSSDKDNSKDKSKSGQQGKQQSQDAKKKANKKKDASNGNSKKQSAHCQQKQSKQNSNSNTEQWQEWLKHDEEYVCGSYENDLQEALLISTLTNKEEMKLRKVQSPDDQGQEKGLKKKGKVQKPQAMSLDEFNKMKGDPTKEAEEKVDEPEEVANFFEEINEFTAEALKLESKTEHFKSRQLKPVTDVHVTLAQFQNVLEEREKEIIALKKKVSKLEADLTDVKARNSQLCSMLAQGEMKNKAEVLLEVEQLKSERKDLWSDLQRLEVQLEQERSKVHALSQPAEKGKSKSKK